MTETPDNRQRALVADLARVANGWRSSAEYLSECPPLIASSTAGPLQWWRRLRADAFTAEHIGTLSYTFAGIGMIGEPQWSAAMRGHAASAVAVALRALKTNREVTPNIDLTMSTLLVPAIVGDAAAITVLAAMIQRFGDNAEKNELIHSWLTRLRKRGHGA